MLDLGTIWYVLQSILLVCLFPAIFLIFWSSLGSCFDILSGYFLSPEVIHNENGEHVIFDDCCRFSHDFQGPKGSENVTLREKMTS